MIEILLPAAVLLLGGVLARAAMAPAAPWAATIAIAPAVGFGFVSLAYFYWRLGGGAVAGFLPLFAGLALAAVAAGWRRRSLAPAPDATGPPATLAARVALGAALAVAAVTFVRYHFDDPLGQFDAKAIWNVRALLLFRAEESLEPIFAQLRYGHPSYPLLLPAGLAGQFALMGGDGVVLPAVQGVVFTAGVTAAVWAGIRLLGGGSSAAWGAAIVLSTPTTQRWGFGQCADVPLAYLLAITGVGLALQLSDSRRHWWPAWLAGFSLGLLPWTKNEGVLLGALLAAAWLAARARLPSAARPAVAPVALGALPGVLSLVAFKALWAPKDEISMFASGAIGRALDPERWSVVARAFFGELSPAGHAEWGLTWAATLVAAILGWRAWRRRPPMTFLGFALLGAWGTWFGIYLGTVHDPLWHLESSLDRLLLQLLPLTVIGAFSAVAASARR